MKIRLRVECTKLSRLKSFSRALAAAGPVLLSPVQLSEYSLEGLVAYNLLAKPWKCEYHSPGKCWFKYAYLMTRRFEACATSCLFQQKNGFREVEHLPVFVIGCTVLKGGLGRLSKGTGDGKHAVDMLQPADKDSLK